MERTKPLVARHVGRAVIALKIFVVQGVKKIGNADSWFAFDHEVLVSGVSWIGTQDIKKHQKEQMNRVWRQ